jgi:predicted nucleic acid-binding protein
MKFADTSFLVALLNPKDQWHSVAKQAAAALDEPVLTTMWVLVELGGALAVGSNRNLFLEFIEELSQQPEWETVPASPDWFLQGLELFRARADKDWSLTDCISFAVMKQRRITDALTHDHHFEQAGFRVLLKE